LPHQRFDAVFMMQPVGCVELFQSNVSVW